MGEEQNSSNRSHVTAKENKNTRMPKREERKSESPNVEGKKARSSPKRGARKTHSPLKGEDRKERSPPKREERKARSSRSRGKSKVRGSSHNQKSKETSELQRDSGLGASCNWGQNLGSDRYLPSSMGESLDRADYLPTGIDRKTVTDKLAQYPPNTPTTVSSSSVEEGPRAASGKRLINIPDSRQTYALPLDDDDSDEDLVTLNDDDIKTLGTGAEDSFANSAWDDGTFKSSSTKDTFKRSLLQDGQISPYHPPSKPAFGAIRRNEQFVTKKEQSNRLFRFQREVNGGQIVQSSLIASHGQTMADLVKRLQEQASPVLTFSKNDLSAIKDNTKRIVFVLEQLDNTKMINTAFGRLPASSLMEAIEDRPIKITIQTEHVLSEEENTLFCFKRRLGSKQTFFDSLCARTKSNNGAEDTMEDLVKRLQRKDSEVLTFKKKELSAVRKGKKRIVFCLEQLNDTKLTNITFGRLTASEILASVDQRPVMVSIDTETI